MERELQGPWRAPSGGHVAALYRAAGPSLRPCREALAWGQIERELQWLRRAPSGGHVAALYRAAGASPQPGWGDGPDRFF